MKIIFFKHYLMLFVIFFSFWQIPLVLQKHGILKPVKPVALKLKRRA